MKKIIINKYPVCTVLLVLAISILCISAAEANINYKVRKGDNLSKISRKFHVSIDKLKEANNLESSDLSIGKKLTIPVKSSVVAKKTESPSIHDENADNEKTEKADKTEEIAGKKPSVVSDSAAAPVIENKYHKVRKRDTLSKIAKRYGLSVSELKELNDLTSSRLKIGQKLIVGQSSAVADKDSVDSVKAKRVSVSEKIAEVQALSESKELADLSIKERLMLFAKKMLNLPYKFGGKGVFGLDCSSFVQKVYGFVNFQLPRSAREQYKVGETVDKRDLQTGDLLFFRTYASFPSHVGIYIGNNLFIHAASGSKKVEIENLDTPYYVKRYIGAKRLLPESEAVAAEVKPDDPLKP